MTTTTGTAAQEIEYVRATTPLGSSTVHVARTRKGAMGTFAACNGRVMAYAVATTEAVTCQRCQRSTDPQIVAVAAPKLEVVR